MIGDQTFEKSRRIRTSEEYARLRREGLKHHTAHFIFNVGPGCDQSRLGITVSRKVGNAVCRNRLKRWIREYFRLRYSRLSGFMDISIVAKRHAGRLDHAQVDRELSIIFARMETDCHD